MYLTPCSSGVQCLSAKKPFEGLPQKAFLIFLTPQRLEDSSPTLKRLAHPLFQLLPGFKTRDATGLNVNLCARLRVAADTTFSFCCIKCSEAGQCDFVVAAQTFGNVMCNGVNGFLRQCFGAFAIFCHVGNKFCFCHGIHPLSVKDLSPKNFSLGKKFKDNILASVTYGRVCLEPQPKSRVKSTFPSISLRKILSFKEVRV